MSSNAFRAVVGLASFVVVFIRRHSPVSLSRGYSYTQFWRHDNVVCRAVEYIYTTALRLVNKGREQKMYAEKRGGGGLYKQSPQIRTEGRPYDRHALERQ